MLKKENIFAPALSEAAFLEAALQTFHFQYTHNAIYRGWTDLLKIKPGKVAALEQIPFLPIEFFKNPGVVSSPVHPGTVRFTSSATTSQTPATHLVNDVSWYEESFLTCFRLFYGAPADYCILALLPNYLQRGGSSLVYMCQQLIRESAHPFSGFFLDNLAELQNKIGLLNASGQKTLLIGVSYALLDLCDTGIRLGDHFTVMETGGMKGTRREMLKAELHAYLKKGFNIPAVHSEYGMTELLSQAYSLGDGLFHAPPWMKFLIREVDDPLRIREDHKSGGISVIDLANQHSCSFIATKDLGRLTENNTLELLGRYDNSDIRGCNLMMQNF